MIKVIEIKNKKYLFLSNSLTFYNYEKALADAFRDAEKGCLREDDKVYHIIKGIINKESKCEENNKRILKEYYDTTEIEISGCDINLLYECNLRCKYCFVNDNHDNLGGVLSKENAKRILDYIFQHTSSKEYVIITLMGGEPLLNMDTFKEILEYGKVLGEKNGKNVKFITTTNASLLDEEKIAVLESYDVGFIMSLDSHEKKINDYLRSSNIENISIFDKVVKIIGDVRDRIDVHINVTVTPYNLDIFDTARFLYEKGVKNIHFYLCDSDKEDMLFNESHINQLKKEYEKICDYVLNQLELGVVKTCQPLTDNIEKIHFNKPVYFPCSVLKNRMAFDNEGKFYPCIVLMENNNIFGDVNNGIDQKSLSALKKTASTEKACSYCWARYLCGGECLSSKLNCNEEQRKLRCNLKRHIFSLRLYMYDYIIQHNLKYF